MDRFEKEVDASKNKRFSPYIFSFTGGIPLSVESKPGVRNGLSKEQETEFGYHLFINSIEEIFIIYRYVSSFDVQRNWIILIPKDGDGIREEFEKAYPEYMEVDDPSTNIIDFPEEL